MLVLNRKKDETIKIGDDITVTVVRCGRTYVRIGIDAPKHIHITRPDMGNTEPPKERT